MLIYINIGCRALFCLDVLDNKTERKQIISVENVFRIKPDRDKPLGILCS